jgi:hypothetical protein
MPPQSLRSRKLVVVPRGAGRFLASALVGIVGLYLTVVLCYSFVLVHQEEDHERSSFIENEETNKKRTAFLNKNDEARSRTTTTTTATTTTTTTWERRAKVSQPTMRYDDFKQVAMELARLPPAETLRRLDEDDPFGVRSLVNTSSTSSSRSGSSLLSLLPCPTHQRISLPDRRNHTRSFQFRNNVSGTFLYFQHLRKAGGTHFCTLAEDNLPKINLPPYYCMPDYQWHKSTSSTAKKNQQERCAGCLHHYTNDEIVTNMHAHRIAGNEWDSFDVSHHFDLDGATYVTSFRDPADRAVSQFRFECLESRGCHLPTFDAFWRRRRELYNVYTWTFSDVGRQGRILQDDQFANDRANAISIAMDTISQFHLVLNMEWLSDAERMIQTVLGFTNTQTIRRKVRPHNAGLQRTDSFNARTLLQNNATYQLLRQSLALDEILTDVARRLFLERLVCPDLAS